MCLYFYSMHGYSTTAVDMHFFRVKLVAFLGLKGVILLKMFAINDFTLVNSL